MTYAPIALFTYARPDHTRQAIASLLQNPEAARSDLYVFSDGPKTEAKREAVEANRQYLRTISGFKSVSVVERSENWGLSRSLIAGITDLTDRFGRVIVVEDDLILSPFFLRYMNEALDKYAHDDRVSAISAFLNPVEGDVPETFFLRYFACWGWGTWKRAWQLFEPDARKLLQQMRWKKNAFDIQGSAAFYGMLYCQKVGLVDSWAVRFYASSFLTNKLVLFPHETLVLQAGMDGSGTHSKQESSFKNLRLASRPVSVQEMPVVESAVMCRAFAHFYRNHYRTPFFKRHYQHFKSFVRRLLNIDAR